MAGLLNGVFLILQVGINHIGRNLFHLHSLPQGGGPVEIGSGVGGLAYAWVIGRRNEKELLNFRPHNVALVGLGSELTPVLLQRMSSYIL